MDDPLDNGIQAILFDLDGTLLDTSADFVHVLNAMLAIDERPPVPAKVIRDNVSNGSPCMVTLGYGLQREDPGFDSLRQRFLDEYAEHTANPDRDTTARLFVGIEPLLAAIEAQNIPWGIVTNKPRGLTLPLLAQLNINERCSVLVCPDDVTHAKPDPESIWLAAETLACNPAGCVYVGDHLRDIEAGRAAGTQTVTALYGFISPELNPVQWCADYNAESPHSLLDWFDGNNWQMR